MNLSLHPSWTRVTKYAAATSPSTRLMVNKELNGFILGITSARKATRNKIASVDSEVSYM
jgi:hypothetical protein